MQPQHNEASDNGGPRQPDTRHGAWWREPIWEPIRRMLCAILLALPRVITRGHDERPRS